MDKRGIGALQWAWTQKPFKTPIKKKGEGGKAKGDTKDLDATKMAT
jgi:hypothetical protein